MSATFPLDFMDLTVFISPIRPGFGDPKRQKKNQGTGEAACFDLTIDDVEATSVWKYWPFHDFVNVGLHEKKGGKME